MMEGEDTREGKMSYAEKSSALRTESSLFGRIFKLLPLKELIYDLQGQYYGVRVGSFLSHHLVRVESRVAPSVGQWNMIDKVSHEESSGVSHSKDHDLGSDNQLSGAKGPSDEMWNVDELSVQEPSKGEVQDNASKAGSAIVKRTGRKTGESQSTSSGAWFSGHETEEHEEATEENGGRSVRQGLSGSHQEEKITHSQIGESSSSSTSQGHLRHVGINAPSSSVIQGNGSPQVSIYLPTGGETSGDTSSPALVDSSIPLPGLRLGRSPAMQEVSEAGEEDTSDNDLQVQYYEVRVGSFLCHHLVRVESRVAPSVGQWNMIDKKMINCGKVDYWACISFSRIINVDRFCHELIRLCVSKGMVFNPNPLAVCTVDSCHIEKALLDIAVEAHHWFLCSISILLGLVESRLAPSVGQWNMIDKKMINGGKVDYWACISFSRNIDVDRFCHYLIGMCVSKGMVFNPNPLAVRTVDSRHIEKALLDIAAEASKAGNNLQFLFIFLSVISGSYEGMCVGIGLCLAMLPALAGIKIQQAVHGECVAKD
ncbi:hypothetical protein ACS0TY_006661 [Phlomoides rotata]